MVNIGNDWDDVLREEFSKGYYLNLRQFLKKEYSQGTVYPPMNDIFNAFRYTPYQDVKVVILGQDPYHEPGQAHGLAFSVQPGVPEPPSLQNIFKELHEDVGFEIPPKGNGCLIPWAKSGVLLLNTALTVRAHQANSHQRLGWTTFTDAAIRALSDGRDHLVFMLWGGFARGKKYLIDSSRHLVLESVHPSPLSANRGGWFGQHQFSRCNAYLVEHGMEPISWWCQEKCIYRP